MARSLNVILKFKLLKFDQCNSFSVINLSHSVLSGKHSLPPHTVSGTKFSNSTGQSPVLSNAIEPEFQLVCHTVPRMTPVKELDLSLYCQLSRQILSFAYFFTYIAKHIESPDGPLEISMQLADHDCHG